MPKGMGYSTGGKVAPRKGSLPGAGEVNGVDVTCSGAGMGTTYNQPNAGKCAGPGGKGSVGSASTSRPSKG